MWVAISQPQGVELARGSTLSELKKKQGWGEDNQNIKEAKYIFMKVEER